MGQFVLTTKKNCNGLLSCMRVFPLIIINFTYIPITNIFVKYKYVLNIVLKSYMITLIKHMECFYLFDPHVRNCLGMPDPNGTAVFMHFANISFCMFFLKHYLPICLKLCLFSLQNLKPVVQPNLYILPRAQDSKK